MQHFASMLNTMR